MLKEACSYLEEIGTSVFECWLLYRDGDRDSGKSSDGEGGNESDEEEEWIRENIIKKEALLETKSKKTHLVHCPYYPAEKFEWWWLFLVDKKLRRLVVPGLHCTTLVDEQTVRNCFATVCF